MEAEYERSVKQSILDYVLLDPAEQRRLGLHMPLPVSLDICHVNFGLFKLSNIWNTSSIACGCVLRQCQVFLGSTYLLTGPLQYLVYLPSLLGGGRLFYFSPVLVFNKVCFAPNSCAVFFNCVF